MTSVQPRKRARRIPEFISYEEEADFWDTHSPLDFPDEFDFDADDVTFAKNLEIVHVKNWRESLVAAVTKLSEGERQVLALNVLGLYPDEIAQVIGCSPAETQKTLRAARRKTRSVTTSDPK